MTTPSPASDPAPRPRPAGARIKAGDPAPDLVLPDQTGTPRRLSELIAGRPAVVYFYPADNTPICTAQACSFRDASEEFGTLDATVIGISSDSPESHAAFAARHRLPFTLLSDPAGTARAAFGVPSTLGLFPGRTTYVIDALGIVRQVFSAQLSAGGHIRTALATLRASTETPPSSAPR